MPAESEKWNDWTSTWRKVGNTGHRKDVTLTGTVTRGGFYVSVVSEIQIIFIILGKKKGQTVDVQLNLTNQELMEISHSQDTLDGPSTPGSMSHGVEGDQEKCGCGLKSGIDYNWFG